MAAISCFDSIPVDKTNNMFYPLILFRRSPEYLDMDVCLFFLTSAFSQTGQMRSPRDSLKRHQNIFLYSRALLFSRVRFVLLF